MTEQISGNICGLYLQTTTEDCYNTYLKTKPSAFKWDDWWGFVPFNRSTMIEVERIIKRQYKHGKNRT